MKAKTERLDIFEVPLQGMNLIEASAGTGKTWTITGLYLRLLLGGIHGVDQILVVTYTHAATAELRDRIRTRLTEARDAFARGASTDAFLARLLEAFPDHARAQRRLTRALRGFDEAAIFTIHGFCQRVLTDSAFESGMPFKTELLAEAHEILQEVVEDFWRRELYQAPPMFVDYLLDQGLSPERLGQAVRAHLGKPYLQVRAPEPPATLECEERCLAAAYSKTQALWGAARHQVSELLLQHTGLNGKRYPKAAIPNWLAAMDAYLRPANVGLTPFEQFKKFTSRHLRESVNKGKTAPTHAFFDACEGLHDACERLVQSYEQRFQCLQAQLLEYCNRELELRKRHKRAQCFDDLLLNLARALQGAGGEALARALRNRYTAALIDEFQDTDPIQYQIFREVYGATPLPVFLVGDPKQAIYSFRGADIFAYLKARADAGQHYTLDVNWRSAPALIRAVNALFKQAPKPFLFQEIPFQTAQPAGCERECLTLADASEAPLILWFLGRDADGKPVGKVKARERIARATAAEVAQLLNLAAQGQAHIGSRPLDGGDIAVLVRTHREGRLVRDALMRLGIASVQQGQDNVFASHEAGELERVLMAIAEPALEAWVSSALATDMLGVPGEALYALREDEQAWEARLETFQDYHRLWRERGFIVMFRALLKREHVALRLLGYRDGERRLTNLLHLSELCQTAANRQRLSIAGLLKWFCEHRQGTDAEDEEVLLRLESDEHLVKIVTMHKSKGLEYPIVFCPFLWDGRLRSEKAAAFTFHDAAEGYQAVLELGSDPHNMRAHACREELAEGLRLAYVALTRAKYRCYLVWGAINEANTSPLAWLLHAPDVLPRDLTGDLAGDLTGDLIGDPITALAEHLSARPDHDLRQDLERLAHGADGAIRVLPLPADEAVPYSPPSPAREALSARQLRQPVPPGWRIASFSLLARGHSPELPDHDADSTGTALAAVSDILAFPRGPRAGRCLHAVFERLDFSRATRTDYEALADKVLREHGFGNEWVTAVSDMVERVLACPLDATGRLHLADISADRRLTELEFYYPIAHLDPRGLRGLLRRHGRSLPAPWRESIETLTFAPTQGFMKGFIDLVFEHGGRYYLVDYKSNWLGPERTAYRTERLAEVMVQEGYPLQYLIYTVALHRHLRLRLRGYRYDTHFGGVFYLFLRGMDPALGPDIGIYRDSPPAALIDALDRYLATGNLHDLARA